MKILLVEDELTLGRYLKRALEEEGYVVELLSDGKEALMYLSSFKGEIDVIVLDILLPGCSGLHIVRELRRRKFVTPVLLLTAKDQEKEKIEGLDSGADDYLTKPFSLKELLARIRSQIRRSTGQMTSLLSVGDICIDSKKGSVFIGEKELSLTPKEYKLLEFFVLHPNQVLGREHILDAVWGMQYDTYSNVVDVHVTALRRKISDTKERNLIQSVRGLGYRMNVKRP